METPPENREDTERAGADRAELEALFKDIARTVQAFHDRVNTALQRVDFGPIVQSLTWFAQGHARAVMQVAPLAAGVVQALRDLPPRIQTALLTLAGHGWFFDTDMGLSELWELEGLIAKGDEAALDALLSSHFAARAQEIEEALVAQLPHRAKFFRSAFAAHRRGEFELAIPVFFAQVDGVCAELAQGHQFFMRLRGSRVPATAAYVQTLDPVSATFLSPLQHTLPVNASTRDRERLLAEKGASEWTQLNRHTVAHGESLDYDTELNSLKAISLLNYVARVLKDA